MPGDTTLCLLTKSSLASPDTARWLFSTFAEIAPELLPERYDSGEPIRRRFSIDTLEEPLAFWGQFPYQGTGFGVVLVLLHYDTPDAASG